MTSAYPQHFAEHVSARRKGLGLTLVEVNHNGGPTAPTLAKAEAGALADPRPSTLSKFDAGLQWTPGSAARTYWEGAEPSPRERKAGLPVLEPASSAVSLPLDSVLELMTALSDLNDYVEGADIKSSASELASIATALNRNISTIVGLFVTDLLERNHATGNQPMQPLIEYAFAELLAQPVSQRDPDRVEKLYRRWLLGKGNGISQELAESFGQRLRRRRGQGIRDDD